MTTLALMALLLAVIVARVLKKRSLSLLSIEQKASAMDETVKGSIWPVVALLIILILPWSLPLAHVPRDYFVGIVAVFLLAVILLSLGASATRLVRLSRWDLPRPYVRSLICGTSLIHGALFLLIITFALYASREFHR